MSIFKLKQWWINESGKYEIEGLHNGSCLKVDRFNCHSDSDCIILGDGMFLKIYKPTVGQESTHALLETELNDLVIQIETGKFIAGSAERQILILHAQSYAIYQLQRKEGHTDAGEQNLIQPLIKHTFTRKSHSLTCGGFGNIKTRDFICIQGLDGSLSFFDQGTFLFMCVFNDIIIPGPVSYIAGCDSFVICKSTWVLEIYSYQQLREFSELNTRQKKNIPQWVYNAGEEISQIQVIQTSNNFSSIIALGERHLCCFQDNGLMKYLIKFDFMPVCFTAFLIGWYYEPGARLLVMVVSDDSKLYIYEGTTLLWSCDLLASTISISRCFLKSLPGGLVSLSTSGVVTVGYLGTEPDLNANGVSMMNDITDPQQVQGELDVTEEALKKIMANEDDADTYPVIEQILKIKADVGKPVQNLFQQSDENNASLHLLMCPVVVILTCEDPKLIENIQITYDCTSPISCTENIVCLDNINGTEIIETQVFLASDLEMVDSKVRIIFTITNSDGKIVVIQRMVLLPLSLYCVPTEPMLESKIKLSVKVNHPCVDLTEIFTDFSKEELLSGNTSAADALTFKYRTTKKFVTFKAAAGTYTIEANDFSELMPILEHFTIKLADHYLRLKVKGFRFDLLVNEEFVKQVTHKFLKSIEGHGKERITLKQLNNELNVLEKQFNLIQKKLLVQYGSLPPGDCDPLEFLMGDTHNRLIELVNKIILGTETVCRAGNTVTVIGNLITYILKRITSDAFRVSLIEEMLSLSSLYEQYQEWEEAVAQASSYIIKNIFKNSEKDKEKLSTVTEQGILSHVNFKRLIKQIRVILDRLFSEAQVNLEQNVENKITRIQEFVEVI